MNKHIHVFWMSSILVDTTIFSLSWRFAIAWTDICSSVIAPASMQYLHSRIRVDYAGAVAEATQ